MSPHKRNGKAAKARRQEAAELRRVQNKQIMDKFKDITPEERLIIAIFGVWESCMECQNQKVVGSDCMTPHCMSIREEESVFYDEVTEDHIQVKGARMIAGLDY